MAPLNRARKEPPFKPGEQVSLKEDKQARLWTVLHTQPGGAIRIQRAGLTASIYTQMNARPDYLTRRTP